MSDDNIQIVKQVYDSFDDGDIPRLLALLADDVKWDHRGPEGVPYNHLYEGRDAVAEFFKILGENAEPLVFEKREFFASGDRVVVLGYHSFRIKPTGKEWGSEFAMAWTVRDGLIAEWHPIQDMTSEVAAYQP